MSQQQNTCSSFPSSVQLPPALAEQPAINGTQAGTPIQIEIGSSDIAKQVNNQMPLQFVLNNQGQLVLQPIGGPQANVAYLPNITAVSIPPTGLITTPAPTCTPVSSGVAVSNGDVLPTAAKKKGRNAVNRVECTVCNKTFSCSANLRDHMRLHTGEKPFKCSECFMEFAQRSNWRLHKRVHTGERPFMCGICGKTFARSSHLPGHVRIHTGEKPFKCEMCGNCFPSSQALKNHIRTHTGEKPYKCDGCFTAFTHSSSLSSHKKKCNGVQRKRGRPIGTGRKTLKKKQPSGRPRGRPKKKVRTGRGRKKMMKLDEVSQDPLTESCGSEESDCAMLDLTEGIPVKQESYACEGDVKAVSMKEISNTPSIECKASGKNITSKLPVRESVRLRKKQENKLANKLREELELTEQASIIIERADIQDNYPQRLKSPDNDLSSNESEVTAPDQIMVNNIESINSQQEAAIAMTNLQHGVLNLAHHQPIVSSNENLIENQGPLVTYVTPMDLANNSSQANQVNLKIPFPQAHQPNINVIPLSSQATGLPVHSEQYITCEVNGREFHVPVSEIYNGRLGRQI